MRLFGVMFLEGGIFLFKVAFSFGYSYTKFGKTLPRVIINGKIYLKSLLTYKIKKYRYKIKKQNGEISPWLTEFN